MKKNDRYLSDKELLMIYGINHPETDLSNKAVQRRVLMEIKYGKLKNYEPIIKNKYIRWLLIIAFIVGTALLISHLFQAAGNKLSWERV